MKKPDDYKSLNTHELHKIARDLLVWNCNQAVSDAIHTKHYNDEIRPLHEYISELNSAWINGNNKRVK